MDQEKLSQVALQLVQGVGNTNAKTLIAYCGSAEAVFSQTKKHLEKVPGVGDKTIAAILSKQVFDEANKIIKNAEKAKQQILHYTDENYPKRLKSLADAPNLLFFQGEGTLNASRTVGIVGTRKATPYGKQITRQIVEALQPYQATIISGLAFGIDIEAHRASLEFSIPTLGIIAGGLDRLYPKEHIKTAHLMQEKNGGILSEHPAGTKPEAHLFPARNRIIAGMADATIVVEAAKEGGALITANIAFSYNKPVFAVPGNIGQPTSEGCNKLISSQTAYIYHDIQDLLNQLDWNEENYQKPSISDKLVHLSDEERKIAEILFDHPTGLDIDELAWKAQTQINKLAGLLLSLELNGLVKPLPGKKFMLIK